MYGSCIPDLEHVPALDDDVVHVHGREPGEVSRHRDEVHRRALVELDKIGGAGVQLPPELGELGPQHLIGRDHVVGGKIDQDLPPPTATRVAAAWVLSPHDAVLENPHP
ncbi:hypothetical protein BHE74_00058453 [Ensete ventricosum]|nr:hypothetical protein GW17_00041156 [Ensete ventricosum]RWW36519.1 hypothetical protein BHE74_00058453 [Ensete ventricosum]RZR99044.1 hypothetical protein BHM03_00028527 [Ensete ventricosum]